MDKEQKQMIYIDPVTQGIEEGLATLVKQISEDKDFETWLVKFDEDDELYQRRILK